MTWTDSKYVSFFFYPTNHIKRDPNYKNSNTPIKYQTSIADILPKKLIF